MSETPAAIFERQLRDDGFQDDPAQREAVQHLDRIWHQLVRSRMQRGWSPLRRRPKHVRGLYLWGGVGRGKTWLMDLFFDSLPFENKRRMHFHRFMAQLHADLRRRADERDPLVAIGREWAECCRVLCFDEFHVSDIADAMLLAGLLEVLFEENVTPIATSNIPPRELYHDGLQRAKFLPAIDLIEANTEVLELESGVDYRLRILERAETWHWPLDDGAHASLDKSFQQMTAHCELNTRLRINMRPFEAVRRGDGVIWFTFDELCRKARGTNDYIELARSFNTVLLAGVPSLNDDELDATRRFIHLVDEFYERQVKLLASAADDIDSIYTGERLAFEFRRTRSRLVEMQSLEYLAKPHLP